MILLIAGEVLTGLFIWTRARKKIVAAKMSSLTAATSVPILSNYMERAAGKITDPRKQTGAKILKKTVRAWVNSDLFDHTVTSFMNEHSLVRKFSGKFNRTALRPEQPVRIL